MSATGKFALVRKKPNTRCWTSLRAALASSMDFSSSCTAHTCRMAARLKSTPYRWVSSRSYSYSVVALDSHSRTFRSRSLSHRHIVGIISINLSASSSISSGLRFLKFFVGPTSDSSWVKVRGRFAALRNRKVSDSESEQRR